MKYSYCRDCEHLEWAVDGWECAFWHFVKIENVDKCNRFDKEL